MNESGTNRNERGRKVDACTWPDCKANVKETWVSLTNVFLWRKLVIIKRLLKHLADS